MPDSLLTEQDLYLFNEGTHYEIFNKLGSHPGPEGTFFAVWAPNAEYVAVIGDFNDWNTGSHPLHRHEESGIWQIFVNGVGQGTRYKYHVSSRYNGYIQDKTDPYALYNEVPPLTASIVWDLAYDWNDDAWMQQRKSRNAISAPIAIYEVHLGSWMRGDDNKWLNYRELGPRLAEYAHRMGFTHVELLPVMEHPYYPSWGYQATGLFAPTSRYGTPQDFMAMIDCLHQHGIGVILDWVPSHFPTDAHGLAMFDGTHLYEHADPRQGFHPDWSSAIFNYGRHEVRSFLISSALFWLSRYHVDVLRVDAVASMLYLDYSRKEGEWVANPYGGRENIEAIEFLRQLNAAVYEHHPDTQTIAEESTAWPLVSRPAYLGGLGFGLKWDMGWMHDSLEYMRQDSILRKYHHNKLTFRMVYAFSENFVLALSHDEVVHMKGSLLDKMPGDDWQKFANLRLLLGYQIAQPGKKLLFMGAEIGQRSEWNHDAGLDWQMLELLPHAGMQRWVADINRLYCAEPAMHELDCHPDGFQWIDCNDIEQSVISLLRRGKSTETQILAICNFTPVPRYNYRIGVPCAGRWEELLNSDAQAYGGSGIGNLGGVDAIPERHLGQPYMLNLTLPPLAIMFLRNAPRIPHADGTGA